MKDKTHILLAALGLAGFLSACHDVTKASLTCKRDFDAHHSAESSFEAFRPSPASPVADHVDGANVVVMKQALVGDEWFDQFRLGLGQLPVGSFKEAIWTEDYGTYRYRRATVEDLQREAKRLEVEGTAKALRECIRQTCEPLETAKQDAQRLYELHNSETTARELQAAERKLKECNTPAAAAE